MTQIMIRPAEESDLSAILDIYNDAILNTTAVYDYQPHTLSMRQNWFAAKQAGGFPVLVAELENHVAGFAALGTFRTWDAYRYTAENSVYVAPHCRGRGIGKRLLGRLIEEAQMMGLHAIVAGIDADNAVSLKLHEHYGFQEVAHFRQVGYKFDRWLDLKFLQRIFE
ncbi:GNAT family N-acetyltransferase [Oscillatoria sp. CS-180]|uniref:GNAT family N-acetyltransferase n=1 Tax=Oscillatoria sp. CS-180 TaxID=3021720 RepID=UPI00232EC508|nr:GNAT family N-acetyltransferase [Oscillatoria sp. CS-180]MDB9526374.1 GNAT family N-acetyltransferase [Oscillatoria sp. CS-180]